MAFSQKMILASGSPRRKELLEMTGWKFEIFPVDADESIEEGIHPEKAVQCLARRKAQMALKSHPDGFIIGADTVVALNGKIFGKPRDRDEAIKYLHDLSGKSHQVYTGVSLASSTIDETFVCCTSVQFFQLSDEEIHTYVESGEPMDKAGAYGIQGIGRFLIERIDGNYDNVVGLPVAQLYRKLKSLDICLDNPAIVRKD